MLPSMKNILKTLVAGIFLTSSAVFADIPREVKQGDPMPVATVKDSKGKDVNLKEAVAKKPAVLVFYRGGWCPFCVKHLSALEGIQDGLTEAGLQLLAISADKPERIAETPKVDELSYTLLSDSSMEAARAFGLTFKVPDETVANYKDEYGIDLEAASGEKHHLLPHPAVFIVDTEGVVRMAYVNRNYRDRLDPALILSNAREVAK